MKKTEKLNIKVGDKFAFDHNGLCKNVNEIVVEVLKNCVGIRPMNSEYNQTITFIDKSQIRNLGGYWGGIFKNKNECLACGKKL